MELSEGVTWAQVCKECTVDKWSASVVDIDIRHQGLASPSSSVNDDFGELWILDHRIKMIHFAQRERRPDPCSG